MRKVLFVSLLAISFRPVQAQQQWTTDANNNAVTASGIQNVGIGTTAAPTEKLQVVGNVRLSGTQRQLTFGNLQGIGDPGGTDLKLFASSAFSGGNITFFTLSGSTLTERMRIAAGGSVGVATPNPLSPFHVGGNLTVGTGVSAGSPGNLQLTTLGASPISNRLTFGTDGSGWKFAISSNYGGTVTDLITVKDDGHVVIGDPATTDTAILNVGGNINVTGNINAKYQDVAEWVSAGASLDAATVVVLDASHDDRVMPCSRAYDTAVAGVVSSTPGVILGVGGAGKEKIATTGRVKVKVDATRAPIAIGDLLVTSDVSGMAMKSEPIEINGRKFHQPGTVIGKALQPLSGGRGEILVLLSLQ